VQENAGIYDPIQHQRALEPVQRGRGQTGEPTAAERVTANVRRLERLARFRLAVRLPDGRWRVPTDLVAQLEAREKTHPQKKEWRIVYYVGRDAIVILEVFAKTTRATPRSVIDNCTHRLARYQKDAGEVS